MNKVAKLEDTLYKLYRSGAGEPWCEEEMMEFLDDIDLFALSQVLRMNARPVPEYRASGKPLEAVPYIGPELLPGYAMPLYVYITDSWDEPVVCRRSLELWLTPAMELAVTSCFKVNTGSSGYVTEYRTYKGSDWRAAGMEIDFEEMASDLKALSERFYDEVFPLYEL